MLSPSDLISGPRNIIAVGLNYADHADEGKVDAPATPVLFAKWSNCLIGDGDAIVLPAGTDSVDWEAELAVVIGRTAQRVAQDDALDFIAGYTVMNDVSDRAAQFSENQWSRAKSYDTFGPVGPRIASAEEIGDPQDLRVISRLNGEVMQSSSTSMMIHSVASLIAFITSRITLRPGDLIATGTPAGVGAFRNPPVFLRPGDVIEVEVDKIGVLRNPVVDATGGP